MKNVDSLRESLSTKSSDNKKIFEILNWGKSNYLDPDLVLDLLGCLKEDHSKKSLVAQARRNSGERGVGDYDWEFTKKFLHKIKDQQIKYQVLCDCFLDGDYELDVNCLKEAMHILKADSQRTTLVLNWSKSKGNILNTEKFTQQDFKEIVSSFDKIERSGGILLLALLREEKDDEKRLKKFADVTKGDFHQDDESMNLWLRDLHLEDRKEDFLRIYFSQDEVLPEDCLASAQQDARSKSTLPEDCLASAQQDARSKSTLPEDCLVSVQDARLKSSTSTLEDSQSDIQPEKSNKKPAGKKITNLDVRRIAGWAVPKGNAPTL